ncbi:MAG: hypothetical protein KIPDCIKN_04181 [Haliscomenobacter sp.]|nr:hypothetical protein [Haliscomenobacter sp.]
MVANYCVIAIPWRQYPRFSCIPAILWRLFYSFFTYCGRSVANILLIRSYSRHGMAYKSPLPYPGESPRSRSGKISPKSLQKTPLPRRRPRQMITRCERHVEVQHRLWFSLSKKPAAHGASVLLP